MKAAIVARPRSVLGAFLVLASDRPFVPAISAAPSKGDGLPVDRRLRPHESSDAAFRAPVRKPKAQIHERGGTLRQQFVDARTLPAVWSGTGVLG
jgi:hypothetical protein